MLRGVDLEVARGLLPGILLITVASGISYTAFRLFPDMQGGIVERFRSMPIARSSVLWAHVLTSLVANLVSIALVIGVALLTGCRSGAGVLAWLAVGGTMPGPVRAFAEHQPVTSIANAIGTCSTSNRSAPACGPPWPGWSASSPRRTPRRW